VRFSKLFGKTLRQAPAEAEKGTVPEKAFLQVLMAEIERV